VFNTYLTITEIQISGIKYCDYQLGLVFTLSDHRRPGNDFAQSLRLADEARLCVSMDA
jgi:hypothetical protein